VAQRPGQAQAPASLFSTWSACALVGADALGIWLTQNALPRSLSAGAVQQSRLA